MGFDTNGQWTSDFYPETDRDDGVAILASKFQKLIQTDIKSGFNNCLTRDGAGKPLANLNLNGYKITNIGIGDLANDALTLGVAQKGQINYASDTSNTANTVIITLNPSISSYTVGQRFYFKVANTNTTSEVTFRANNLDICRIQIDGNDNLVAGTLKQNSVYEGIYLETGNTAEATYAGRRVQIIGQSNDLLNTLNNKQVTNCILSAPNGVATYSGSVVTVENEVRFLIYHGLNADGTINNIEYITSGNPTYSFTGTEADGTYYLFIDNTGLITASTSNAQQTDKAIFAECEFESGAITSFTAYGALELVKKRDVKAYIVETYDDGNGNGYRLYSDNWCEQYGYVSSSVSNNTFVVTFLKQFADTNYNFIKDYSYSANTNVYQSQANVAKTTTTATVYAAESHGTLPRLYQWRACGYIS